MTGLRPLRSATWLALAALLVACGGAQSAQSAQSLVRPSIQVQWKNSKLSVVAENMPLAQILAEVGKQTGVQMQNLPGLTDSVSAHFSDLTLRAGLQSLLSGVDYAVFGSLRSPAGLAEARVVILKNLEASAVSVVAGPPHRMPPVPIVARGRPIQRQVPPGNGGQPDKQALMRQVMGPDLAAQAKAFESLMGLDPQAAADALEQAVRDGQGAARLQALQLLDQDSQADDQTMVGVLRQTLQDGDVSMRDYAVQAIARRGGPETMDLLTEAYRDSDPQVRMAAIQDAAQQTGGLDLLRQAVSDPDPGVASAASALVQALTATQEQQ